MNDARAMRVAQKMILREILGRDWTTYEVDPKQPIDICRTRFGYFLQQVRISLQSDQEKLNRVMEILIQVNALDSAGFLDLGYFDE